MNNNLIYFVAFFVLGLPLLAIVVSFYLAAQRRRAERQIEEMLQTMQAIDKKLRKRVYAVQNQDMLNDIKAREEARKIIEQVLEKLSERHREIVREGLYQSSEVGRANYTSKIIAHSKAAAS